MNDLLLPPDFRQREDALDVLAAALGRAIASSDDEAFGELLREVHPLLEAGLEYFAQTVVLAALGRTVTDRPLRAEDFSSADLDADRYAILLQAVIDDGRDASTLRAGALAAAADIATHRSEFLQA